MIDKDILHRRARVGFVRSVCVHYICLIDHIPNSDLRKFILSATQLFQK